MKQLVELIQSDRNRGARELTIAALNSITDFLDHWKETDPLRFGNQLLVLLDELANARPSMIPIMNAMETVRKQVNTFTRVEDQKLVIIETIRDLIRRIQTALDQIIDLTLNLFHEKKFSRVLTHSYSSTIVAFLKAAGKKGFVKEVIITESRPLYEGVSLAKELLPIVRVTLITDAQASRFISDCDAIILGADAIGKDHSFLNKVGSRQIALCAHRDRIPIIVLGETMKVHPFKNAVEIPKEEMSAEELGHDLPGNVRIRNIYFEEIEKELVDYWISEKGVESFTDN